jgi:hypothetical protein
LAARINLLTKDWTQKASFLVCFSAGFTVAALGGLLVLLGRRMRERLSVAFTFFADDGGRGVEGSARELMVKTVVPSSFTATAT